MKVKIIELLGEYVFALQIEIHMIKFAYASPVYK